MYFKNTTTHLYRLNITLTRMRKFKNYFQEILSKCKIFNFLIGLKIYYSKQVAQKHRKSCRKFELGLDDPAIGAHRFDCSSQQAVRLLVVTGNKIFQHLVCRLME